MYTEKTVNRAIKFMFALIVVVFIGCFMLGCSCSVEVNDTAEANEMQTFEFTEEFMYCKDGVEYIVGKKFNQGFMAVHTQTNGKPYLCQD